MEDSTPTKTTIINNINPYKNPITSGLGIILSLTGLVIIVLPVLYAYTKGIALIIPCPNWTGWALLGAGILLLLAPDKLVGIISKKSDQ